MDLRNLERFQPLHPWLTACLVRSMSIAFRVNRRSGDYIKATVVPSSRSRGSHFGAVDGFIMICFVAAIGGLIYLLAR
jgi:hypothetical protein